MHKKILVPLDGSKLAESPLDYAVWLAEKSGAELRLIHVYQGRVPGQSQYLARKVEWIRSRDNRRGAPRVNVEPVVARGDPASEILQYVEDNEIDLIAMSTHGRTGVRRWLMGSVADRVVRHSNRPVRLVKSFADNRSRKPNHDTSVVALLDGSEVAEQVLPYAAYHAGLGEGELILLSVCEPPQIVPAVTYHLIPPEDYPPTRPLQWDQYVEQETEQRKQKCSIYLERLAEVYKGKAARVSTVTPSGSAAEEILRYLQNNTVSLVAMTTRGRSGLSRWVFGSVAEKVLQASPSPVLIIRPR